MIDRIGSAARVRTHDDDHSPEAQSPRRAPARADAFAGAAIAAHIDGGLAEFVRNAAAAQPSRKDDVLHIGMNRSAAKNEIAELAPHAQVTALAHGRDGVVTVAGATYDLKKDDGCEAFAAVLRARGLSSEQADAVMKVIGETGTTGKDEIAHLALLWTAGERGEAIPGRIVLSGHSSGDAIWDGGGDGEISFADVQKLARVMPRAAAQIEDIHISACSTGGQAALAENREAWVESFPSLKTLWAYDGSAPHEGKSHLADWARATKGDADRLALTDKRATENVGVWDRVSGYRDGSEPLAVMRTKQNGADARFDGWMSGARRAAGSDDPALVADYRTYRSLSQRSDLPKAERDAFERKADQLLRLRYFEGAVRRELDRNHGADVAKGFRKLGLPAPRLSSLSFRDALAAIDKFERACAARGDSYDADVAKAREILNDIRSLDAARIQVRWCRH